MSHWGSVENVVVLVTDNTARSGTIAAAASPSCKVHMVELGLAGNEPIESCSLLIADVALSDRDTVAALRLQLSHCKPSLPILFVSDTMGYNEQVQANFLGARDVVPRAQLTQKFAAIVAKHAPVRDLKSVVGHVEDVNQNLFTSVAKGEVLPAQEVENCADLIAETIARDGLASWMQELKNYHSYTHRHSMHVNGLAVAFGLTHGMRVSDVRRLATGALLHDIGKARIPLDILDKPHLLSREENRQMRKHPEYSAEVLVKDGQFDPEVADVARHHHEYLDGSGYPDGLVGHDISDLVRIVTIADVFSALVDRRSYKNAMPKMKAYAVLCSMKGKLDMALVRAFEPIALESDALDAIERRMAS